MIRPPPEKLVDRVQVGEIVFFVGAGFSIDSEWLSATVIMQRLWLRLAALDALRPKGAAASAVERFQTTFNVDCSPKELQREKSSAIADLATRYYEVNSWLAEAFGELLKSAEAETYKNFTRKLGAAEQAALAETKWENSGLLNFASIPEAWWNEARGLPGEDTTRQNQLGKLIFIHSTGLFDHQIMAGDWSAEDASAPSLQEVDQCYGDRLRPRHHVIARFAREGFCPIAVTTNFDLLLEGAFRLSGFCPAQAKSTDYQVQCTLPKFDVIASPEAFFSRGKAFHTATVVKLHGCAGILRNNPNDIDLLFDYLPQLVYTYREIQHWRDDSWAADFVRTLLRTRTMVFSGYSTQDPVLHDTIRTIYEEMARKRAALSSSSCAAVEDAPAYFLAFSKKETDQEFHGNEVLKAASKAVGSTLPALRANHPNYLRFVGSGSNDAEQMQLDELMLWLQHRVLRSQQTNALRTELPGLMNQLLGHRPLPGEIDTMVERFTQYVQAESAALNASRDPRSSRRSMRKMTNWSHGFHVALRREWAHAHAHLRQPGKFRTFSDLNHRMWYFPASEQPAWTAWSAVLELAMVHLSHYAAKSKPPNDFTNPTSFLRPTLGQKPCVLFRRSDFPTAKTTALTLEFPLPVAKKQRYPETTPGNPAQHTIWQLTPNEVPWKPQSSLWSGSDRSTQSRAQSERRMIASKALRRLSPPDAGQLWDLALRKLDDPTEFIATYLSP